jgi:serine phosphatase RsbU (regulator of sigma subunit)
MFPGLDGRDELVASFQGELGGSAALAELWAAKLVREGALTRRGRGWSVSLGHEALSSPPTDLADAVADQLSRLGGSLREVLADVAVLPDGSSAALVARLGGHDPARLERDLDELERLDLILAPSSESGRRVHAFSGLVRQAVAKNMGELRRERAGRLLDASEGLKDLEASERAQLAEIAERRDTAAQAWEDALAAARERGDEGRALTAARRLAGLTSGADRGRALRAAASAAVHLERFEDAEQLMESAEAEPCEDLADRLDRLDMAATVASRTGRLSEAEDLALERLEATPRDSTDRWSALSGLLTCRARDSSAQWEDLAEQLKDLSGDDAALLAEHQMHVAVAQLTRNHIPEAVEALSAALQGGLGRAREAAAFNNLGVAELRARNLKRSSRALGRAADIRREIGARVALSGTLVNLSLVDLELGRPAAASRRLRESLAIKREAGDRGGATLCLTNLAVAEYNRQELGEVLRLAEETRAESASVTAVRANAVVDMLDYDVRVQLGDRAGAATARDRLGSIEEDEGFRAHLAQLAIVRALEETGEGRRDRAIERLAALDAGGSLGDYDRLEVLLVQASLSLHAEETRRRPLEAASGDPELARAALRRIDELSADGSIMTPPLRLHLHLARAAAWDALGRRGRVRRELEQALACGGRSSERLLLGEVDAALGLEASRRANWPEAETHYESALRRVRAMARRLPAEHREGFLRQPRQAGLREALLSVREAQRRKEAEGSFFGPLRAAGAAGPARGAHAVGKQADGARQAKRLREVIEVTRDINALVPVGELLDRILDRVLGLMNAERGFIVLSGEGSEAEFAAARDRSGRRVERAEFAVSRSVLDEVMSTGKPVLSSDARADQRFVSKQSVLLLDLRSVLVAPLVAREEVIGALYVDNSQRAGAFGETELDLIALFAAQAAVAVENARLHETRVAKDLLDQELRIARGIQERLIPTTLPVIPGYRLAASMRPARELGGDYYDGLELPDGRVRVAIGDVSGKGIPAGLVMVMAHSILREVGFADEGLDRILERANAALESRIEDDKFMTLLLLEPEPGGRGLKLALAGHEPPLLWRSRDRRVEVLEAGGLALGMLPDLTGRLREDRVELEPGDLLCWYTDGVTECRAPDGVLYGRARLEAAIAVHAHRGAAGLRAALETELDAYRAGGERSDDLTLLVLATCDEEGDAR